MAVFNNILAGASGQAGGAAAYEVERSLRFNSGDSAYLSRTPASAGNRKTWTWSGWVKRSGFANNKHTLFAAGTSNDCGIHFGAGDAIRVWNYSGSYTLQKVTTAVFRDPSAWYHIVVAVDTTDATAEDRCKVYVNGVRQTSFSTNTIPSQNTDLEINTTVAHGVGYSASYGYLDAYLANVHFVDGLTPGTATDDANGSITGIPNAEYLTDFGEFDATTGQWVPKAYTFSTNPNNGTTWSATTNGNFNTTGSRGADKAFNGNVNGTDYAQADTGTTATVSNLGITGITSIRVNIAKNSTGDNWGTFALDSTDLTSWLQTNYAGIGNSGTWIDVTSQFTSSTLSSISITTDNGGTVDVRLAGVEINGYVLLDGADDNAFHLKFDDLNDLGTDSANGNDWTVNNISVGGAQYSSTLTATSAHPSGNPASYGFDGVPSSSNANTFLANSGGACVWDASSYGFTNVEVEVYVFGVGGTLRKWQVNSGTEVDEATSAGWQNLGTFSTLSEIRCNGYGGYGGAISAIRLNGSILVDSSDNDNDSLFDSPSTGTQSDSGLGGEVSGNYATLNPLDSTATLSNGNLDATTGSWGHGAGTIAITQGKWYIEALCVSMTGAGALMGFSKLGNSNIDAFRIIYEEDGKVARDGTGLATVTGLTTYGGGDLIGVSIDMTAGEIKFYKNGTLIHTTTDSVVSSTDWRFHVKGDQAVWSVNFGQRAFAYTAPSGFKALCTTNLTDPTITDPSDYMDVALYTGNGSTQTISGLGFSPDLVWLKSRSDAYDHHLIDSVRGVTKAIFSNRTAAETTYTTGLTAFNADGFTLGGELGHNGLNKTYVGWTWDAGSSTASNTDGSITSSVRANASAGFSIVSYTGTGSNATVGHGLNAELGMIIVKNRSTGNSWAIYHSALGGTKVLQFDTNAAFTDSVSWNDTDPTSSVFTIGTGSSVNGNTNNLVAYCFAPVAGYSAFGSVSTNGTTDNSFVFLGFRAKFIMFKRSDDVGNWTMWDTSRNTYNVMDNYLFANSSGAEGVSAQFDILSNGIKIRTAGFVSGGTYIYAAFAESPFKYANAR